MVGEEVESCGVNRQGEGGGEGVFGFLIFVEEGGLRRWMAAQGSG